MPTCRDCKSLKWLPVCRAWNLVNRDPVGEHDCVGFQLGPKPLVEELVETLDAILHALTGIWFSYTHLPGKIEDAEIEAQKLVNRAEELTAEYRKEQADGQQ